VIKKGLLYFLLIAIVVVVAEGATRAFWRIKFSVPMRDPGSVLYSHYPELMKVDQLKPTHVDTYFDVLLLGGSVLNEKSGTVGKELQEQLTLSGKWSVRVFNMARSAHTSRDSLLKYKHLGDARFEMVVFYHGINEARANNVPPELFKEDYSHYSWYEVVNTLTPYHKATSFSLAYTPAYLAVRIKQVLQSQNYVPVHSPRKEWAQYGSNLKSVLAFERNLKEIVAIAAVRGDGLLLMTFALHIPEDYSERGFQEKRLDYLLHRSPVKLWGDLRNVVAAVEAHNRVLRRVMQENDTTLFVDQATQIERSATFFNDLCHFTTRGSAKFVENMIPAFTFERE